MRHPNTLVAATGVFTMPCIRIMRLVLALLGLMTTATASAETWHLASPNGRVQIEVNRTGTGLPKYSVKYAGNLVISPSVMGLDTTLSFCHGAGYYLVLIGICHAQNNPAFGG